MVPFIDIPNVRYANKNADYRRGPVQQDVITGISEAVKRVDPDLVIVVTSGGQPARGETAFGPATRRTGSDRHDHGESVDFVLEKNGKRLSITGDRETYLKVAEEAAAQGFTGIGEYTKGSGHLHVGGGSTAAWGYDPASRSSISAALSPDFREAINKGRSRAKPGQFVGAAPTPPIRPNGLDSLNEATRMAQGPETRPDLQAAFGNPAYFPNSDVPYAGGRPRPVQASFSPPPLPRPRPERSAPSPARQALNSMLAEDEPDNTVAFDVAGYFDQMDEDIQRAQYGSRDKPRQRSYSQQPMAPSLDRRPKPKPTYAHQQMAPSRPLPISKPEPLTYQVTNQGGAVQRLKGGPDPVLPHNVRPNVPPIPGVSNSIVPPSTSNASRIIESYINTPLPGSGLASPAVPSMPSGLRANAPVPPMPPPGLQAGAPVPPMRPQGLGNMAAPMVAPPPLPRSRPSYTPNNSGNYVIRPGDTLSGIAAATGMSLANLRALNPNITDPNFIRAGDTLNTGGGSSSSRTRTASTSRSTPRTTSQSRPRTTSKPKNTNVFNRDTGRWFDAATNKWVYT